MKRSIIVEMLIILMMLLSISCYAQVTGEHTLEHTLFVGEFENKSDVVNPLLSYLNDTLDFLFSRSKLAKIHPISPGLRSAYLRRARIEQPNIEPKQLALLAAGYSKADVVLVGSYNKTGDEWTMMAQLFVMREGSQAREDIQLVGGDVYILLDNLAAEVSKRLGTGQYVLLSTKSWEAYEAYRQGHQAYYNFDTMGAINHFKRAIKLDPQLAIAQAELGLSYWMFNKHEDALAMLQEAMKNLQYASKTEQMVVVGLRTYCGSRWSPDRAAEFSVPSNSDGDLYDMPRMREDTLWDEPWLLWYFIHNSRDSEDRRNGYKLWLTAAKAYTDAGFYNAAKLVNETMMKCAIIFRVTSDQQFLEAESQFASRAAEMDPNDEYDDAWKHWELADICSRMERAADVKKHREQWIKAIKSKPLDGLSAGSIDELARKCLEIELLKDAMEFASKAVAMESDPALRPIYLVTLADIQSASGELDEAFHAYVEAFEASARGDAGTDVLSGSLSGLTLIMSEHPEFVDEPKRTKLNEMVETIGGMDPLLFRSDYAARTINGLVLSSARDFCLAMGDIGPILTLVRGMLKAETKQLEQLVFLNYLSSFEGGVTESEMGLLEEGLTAVEDAFSRFVYRCNLIYIYQQAGEYDRAEALLHTEDAGVIFEAEEADSITPVLQAQEDEGASNGKCIGAPYTGKKSEGGVEYTFHISKPGKFMIVGRVLALDDNSDSFFVSMDGGEKHIWVIEQGPNWAWAVANKLIPGSDVSLQNTTDLTYNLTVGRHILRIGNREDGTKLDIIAIVPLQGE